MIYELRIYDAVLGKMRALHDRFANVTLGYFKKHGIQVVGFWTEDVGTSNRLIYLLAFEDLGHRERAWAAFGADPERARAFAESEKDGPLVARIQNRILRPTSYSPLR